MNILEHYIVEIISEEKIRHNGEEFYRVVADVDCYGVTERINAIFPIAEWQEAKEKGYYMA